MAPSPKRQPMVKCPHCGAMNDPARGSKHCFSCNLPLSQAVTPFEFPATGQTVRTVEVDGDPWFVAADVTTVLGYGGGARNTLRRLPERMKDVEEINTPGGVQRMTVVSESGVYRMVMRSNLPAAEAFQDWIAKDVVPAIRRTGSYVVDQCLMAAPHPDPRTEEYIARLVAAAPLPTPEQRDRLARMLRTRDEERPAA